MSGTTTGFIGLGKMGVPMSTCLARAGFALRLLDADTERQAALCRTLGAGALTAAAAGEVDVLITMLPKSDTVEQVLLAQGWADRLAPGSVVIGMSSSEPMRSRALGGTLAQKRLGYLDAPVSGGVKRAETGTLAIIVGGDADLLVHCRPVLEAMGKSILHVGGHGAGHAAKALNNLVSAAGLMATVEALQVARRFGIAPKTMTDVLNASTGRSNTSENKVERYMLNARYDSGFSLLLMDKDLRIAGGLAEQVGYPLRLCRTGIELWHEVAAEADGQTDHTEMYRFLDPDA